MLDHSISQCLYDRHEWSVIQAVDMYQGGVHGLAEIDAECHGLAVCLVKVQVEAYHWNSNLFQPRGQMAFKRHDDGRTIAFPIKARNKVTQALLGSGKAGRSGNKKHVSGVGTTL